MDSWKNTRASAHTGFCRGIDKAAVRWPSQKRVPMELTLLKLDILYVYTQTSHLPLQTVFGFTIIMLLGNTDAFVIHTKLHLWSIQLWKFTYEHQFLLLVTLVPHWASSLHFVFTYKIVFYFVRTIVWLGPAWHLLFSRVICSLQ